MSYKLENLSSVNPEVAKMLSIILPNFIDSLIKFFDLHPLQILAYSCY